MRSPTPSKARPFSTWHLGVSDRICINTDRSQVMKDLGGGVASHHCAWVGERAPRGSRVRWMPSGPGPNNRRFSVLLRTHENPACTPEAVRRSSMTCGNPRTYHLSSQKTLLSFVDVPYHSWPSCGP